jgi:hypothetical protein
MDFILKIRRSLSGYQHSGRGFFDAWYNKLVKNGKASEYKAAELLGGNAFVTNKRGADVYWTEQGRWVEVKEARTTSSAVGTKTLHCDMSRNKGEYDYCMFMIYIDDVLDRAYLIPRADIPKKSVSLPKNWNNFRHKDRLFYARSMPNL